MRTPTAQETAIVSGRAGMQRVWLKVEIDRDNAGTWVDLTDLHGIDWVLGVSYGESVDITAWTARVTFRLHAFDNPEASLSPLMANSILNDGGVMIQPYRRIKISTATVPIDDPKPSTFNLVFAGRIDSYEISGNTVSVACRDRTSDLQDCFIETEKTYGDDDPTSPANANELQDIIQDLIDDHYNTRADIVAGYSGAASTVAGTDLHLRDPASGGTVGVPYHLYSAQGTAAGPWNSADDTGWSLRSWVQQKSPLFESLVRLADMIGYSLRFRWHNGSGISDIVLVLEEPDRSSTTANLTLDPTTSANIVIKSLSLDITGIRNVWRVGFPRNGGTASSTVATDAASISKYGRRYAEINEGSSSQIDTSTEAVAMRDALLADTKEPVATVQIETPYLYYVQLNDLIKVKADGRFLDSDQTLAVISRQNTIQQGGAAKSVFVLQGTVQSAKRRKHASKQRVFFPSRSGPNLLQSSSGSGLLQNGTLSNIGNE